MRLDTAQHGGHFWLSAIAMLVAGLVPARRLPKVRPAANQSYANLLLSMWTRCVHIFPEVAQAYALNALALSRVAAAGCHNVMDISYGDH